MTQEEKKIPYVHDITGYPPGVCNCLSKTDQSSITGSMEALTGAQFQGPSSPQLHIAYTISLPVDWSALDIFA